MEADPSRRWTVAVARPSSSQLANPSCCSRMESSSCPDMDVGGGSEFVMGSIISGRSGQRLSFSTSILS